MHNAKMIDDRPDFAQRLEAARMARGFKTAAEACRFFGWNYTSYTQHESGIRGIGRAAGKYAQAFRVSEGWLLTGEGAGGPDDTIDPVPLLREGAPLPYAGEVQAGAFRLVDDLNQDWEEFAPEWVLPDAHPRFARVRQYAYRARGDSMNEAGILEGMWIVAADAADYIDRRGDLETGDLVVVERTRAQGAERELTVKEVRFYRDRYELHPRSSNPEHKPIIVPHDHRHNGDAMEVKIVGVVLTAYADLKRRKAT